MNIADELLDIKKALDTASENRNKAQGRLEVLQKQMKELGFNSLEELDTELEKLKKEYEANKEKIEGMINEFRRKYADML